MSDAIHVIDLGDQTRLEIYPDEDCPSPREDADGNLGVMVCFHDRYDLGDKDHGYRQGDFNNGMELEARIKEDHDPVLILPVSMYDHSGVSLSVGLPSEPWDSSFVGFIFTTEERIRECFDVTEITPEVLERARKSLEKEVEIYGEYVNGSCYRFVHVRICEHCGAKREVIESMGGFIGLDHTKNGLLDEIPEQYQEKVRAAL